MPRAMMISEEEPPPLRRELGVGRGGGGVKETQGTVLLVYLREGCSTARVSKKGPLLPKIRPYGMIFRTVDGLQLIHLICECAFTVDFAVLLCH